MIENTPRKVLYEQWKFLVYDFCNIYLEISDDEEVELDRLIDAVEIATGIYSPHLIEMYLYENKYLVENEKIQNVSLESL